MLRANNNQRNKKLRKQKKLQYLPIKVEGIKVIHNVRVEKK